MKNGSRSICQRCGAGRVKAWDELKDDEKMLAERLPMSGDYPLDKRKKHRFCTKCWHEEVNDFVEIA